MAADGNPAVQMVLPMAELVGWLHPGVGELIREAGLQSLSLWPPARASLASSTANCSRARLNSDSTAFVPARFLAIADPMRSRRPRTSSAGVRWVAPHRAPNAAASESAMTSDSPLRGIADGQRVERSPSVVRWGWPSAAHREHQGAGGGVAAWLIRSRMAWVKASTKARPPLTRLSRVM